MIVDSCSNLEICGVSNTHFHYCLDEVSSYHSYKDFVKINESGYQLKARKIPLNSIKYYKIEGSVQYTANVQGGGVNLQGAVVGALVGGDAAAVIGSRVGTETRTSIEEHDNRSITLFYEENGNVNAMKIVSKDFEETIAALRKLIPQKDEAMAMLEVKEKQSLPSNSFVNELKELKELLDNGIISQEEFEAKKKQILRL